MLKMLKFAPIIMCILFLTFPVISVVANKMDFYVRLYSDILNIALISLVSLAFAIGLLINKGKLIRNKINKVFAAFALPLSLVCAVFFVSNTKNTSFLFGIFIFITIISALCIFIFYSDNLILQIILCVLSVLILLYLGLIILFNGFGSNTVVKSINSPDNTYTAELIDNDQGALGGATIVQIQYNKEKFTFLFGEIVRHPKSIYDGKWGEFDTMILKWENENTLLINDVPYIIN